MNSTCATCGAEDSDPRQCEMRDCDNIMCRECHERFLDDCMCRECWEAVMAKVREDVE